VGGLAKLIGSSPESSAVLFDPTPELSESVRLLAKNITPFSISPFGTLEREFLFWYSPRRPCFFALPPGAFV